MPNRITVHYFPMGQCPVCQYTPRVLDIVFETDYVGGQNVTVTAICDNGHKLELYESSDYAIELSLRGAKWHQVLPDNESPF